MGGGGVTPDTCLAFNRRCWTLDMMDRPDTRPEIEPCFWDVTDGFAVKNGTGGNSVFFDTKDKPDLIIFDPPYFDKKAKKYAKKSIAGLPKLDYLEFFKGFFAFMKRHAKKTTRLAFIIADWRDFQKKPAVDENPENAILLTDYFGVLDKTGWQLSHIIQAPMSSERFHAGVVSAMQKKRILGVTSRYVLILKQFERIICKKI